MRFLARFKLIILTLCILALLPFAVVKVNAQTSSNSLFPATEPGVPQNTHTLSQGLLNDIGAAIVCQLIGQDPTVPTHQCLITNPINGMLGYAPSKSAIAGGAIGATAQLISYTINPPVHFSDYTAYLGNNFGIAKKAYAQTPGGIGFTGLTPLMGAWITFRNLVYLIYAVIFVIIGGAIMLRIKLDPRTVMSIENSLPKVIISLVLVTFSFAIAGLLVDVMWLAIFLGINLMGSIDPGLQKDLAYVTGNVFQNPFGFVNNAFRIHSQTAGWGGLLEITAAAGRSVQELLSNIFQPGHVNELGLLPPDFSDNCHGVLACAANRISDFAGKAIESLLGTIISYFVSWIVGIIAMAVVFIAILVSLIRLWFQLLQSYVLIILDVITAPFWIMYGAFPGAKSGFELWIRDMMGYLMAFPIAIILFLFARYLLDVFSNTDVSTLFVAPLIGNPSNGTGGAGTVNNPFGAILALGIILLAPQAVKISRDAFKSPNIPYIAPIFQMIGVGTKTVTGIGKTIAHGVFGQEIEYDKVSGQIKPIQSVPGKILAGWRKRLG